MQITKKFLLDLIKLVSNKSALSKKNSPNRYDLLNPSNIVIYFLVGFSLSVFIRPNHPILYPVYSTFPEIMPWLWWGYMGTIIAVISFITPPKSLWRSASHSLNVVFFITIAGAFTANAGISSASFTYSIISFICMILFARTTTNWLRESVWWHNTVNDPPPWLRRLAGINQQKG